MAVSNENFYKPENALHELATQQTIIDVAIDIQMLLRILVDKGIITKEEVNQYRQEVRNSPKYKSVLDEIQKQRQAFEYAKDNPQEYLKAMFNAKMNAGKGDE